MKAHFERLAHYNRWANRRLFGAAAALPDDRFREERGAFFGSLCGTLNHLLVADRVWLDRIEGRAPAPVALDAILHERFDALREARAAEDERLLRVVSALEEDRLDRPFAYRNLKGEAVELPFAPVLVHVFNHQTHHRGQAHTLLSQFGLSAPPLDFLYFLQDR